MIVAKENLAHGTVGDDAGQRLQHFVRRRRERDGLDQQQTVVDGVRSEILGEHAEQNVILPRDVDGVAGREGLVPVGAEHQLPFGDHVHPMAHLGLRRPGDVLFQERSLLLGKGL